MSSRRNRCGAATSDRKTCQNKVSLPGERCRHHKRKPLSGKSILKLCYSTIRVVSELGGAVAALQIVHPHVMSLYEQMRGILFPEHFWEDGFGAKDVPRMLKEEREAHKKSKRLEEKYSFLSENNKLKVERTYREILAYVESSKVGA